MESSDRHHLILKDALRAPLSRDPLVMENAPGPFAVIQPSRKYDGDFEEERVPMHPVSPWHWSPTCPAAVDGSGESHTGRGGGYTSATAIGEEGKMTVNSTVNTESLDAKKIKETLLQAGPRYRQKNPSVSGDAQGMFEIGGGMIIAQPEVKDKKVSLSCPALDTLSAPENNDAMAAEQPSGGKRSVPNSADSKSVAELATGHFQQHALQAELASSVNPYFDSEGNQPAPKLSFVGQVRRLLMRLVAPSATSTDHTAPQNPQQK